MEEKKQKSIWKQRGFYVCTICLIMVVAAVAYFSHLNSIDNLPDQSAEQNEKPNEVYVYPENAPHIGDDNDKKAPGISENSIKESDTKENIVPEKEESKPQSSDTSAAKTEEPIQSAASTQDKKVEKALPFEKASLTYPVYGTISQAYSGDKLVKSKTLDEWRCHGGIDIKSAQNTQVKAVEAGVVEKVYTDPDLGRCVLIDHENGFKTLYGNLLENDMVKTGDKVQKGKIIGGVGKTAISEVGEEAHLHFEMMQNNKEVNPTEYLKKIAIEN